MSERSFVIVSREWKNFEIRHRVVYAKDHIRIESDLDEFVDAMCREMVPYYFRWTVRWWIRRAVKPVVQDMKKATIFSPPPLVIKD